jgi:mRNA interferase MazF
MFSPGDVILTKMQFANSFEIKTRPAVVLFEELGNVIVAGVTSNVKMKGIPLSVSEGAVKDSVIKLNYIFTVSDETISKKIFKLSKEKKQIVFEGLSERLEGLRS